MFLQFRESAARRAAIPGTEYRNAEYVIEGQRIKLADGLAEAEISPGSASRIVTRYFGNELKTDLNDDGREDVVFLLTQQRGGSGTFFSDGTLSSHCTNRSRAISTSYAMPRVVNRWRPEPCSEDERLIHPGPTITEQERRSSPELTSRPVLLLLQSFARLTVCCGCSCDGCGPGGGKGWCCSSQPPSIVGIAKAYEAAGAVARDVLEDHASTHPVEI